MKILHFEIEESIVNKGMKILVATAENGEKYVVGGDPYNCIKLVRHEECFDVIGIEEHKRLTGY